MSSNSYLVSEGSSQEKLSWFTVSSAYSVLTTKGLVGFVFQAINFHCPWLCGDVCQNTYRERMLAGKIKMTIFLVKLFGLILTWGKMNSHTDTQSINRYCGIREIYTHQQKIYWLHPYEKLVERGSSRNEQDQNSNFLKGFRRKWFDTTGTALWTSVLHVHGWEVRVPWTEMLL